LTDRIFANLDNQGVIELVNRDLVIEGTHTFTTDDGTLTIPDGRVLTFNTGTTAIFGTSTTLTPTATGRINVNGDITLASDFTLSSGEPAFNFDNNADNVTTINGPGSFTNADTVLLRADVIDVSFINQGFLTANDGATGSVFNGAFDNPVTGVFRIYAEDNTGVTVANAFTNAGLIDISQGSGSASYASTLTVSTGTLVNTGTIQSSQGLRAGTRVLAADVGNQGVVSALDHPLTVNATTFTNSATGALEGASTIDFGTTSVSNLGATSPGTGGTTSGVLTFSNSFSFDEPGSSLNIDLNGLTVGTEYDQLAVSGPLTLNGTLNVAVDAGFTPVEGNTFRVLTATSFTGGFSDMFFPGIGAGLDIDPVWSATALDLVVVAIPPGTDAIWEGASSTDWHDAANWSTGTVPTEVENVWIRQAPLNQPVVSATAEVGSVVVQPGASITINTGVELSVFGSLDAGTSIIGTGTVAMYAPGTLSGTIPNLVVWENVTLGGTVNVTGTATVSGGLLTLAGNTMTVDGAFSTSGTGILVMNDAADVLNITDATFDGGSTDTYLSAGTMNVTGNFVQASTNSTTSFAASGTHLTVFNGTGPQSISFANPGDALSHFQDLQVTNTAQVNFGFFASANILGSFTIDGGGSASLVDNIITVGGDFSTAGSGTLSMTQGEGGSTLDVAGNVTFGGGSTDGILTAGTLAVGGSFQQLSTNSSLSFAPSLNHTTRFDGAIVQTIDFASPDSVAGSHFYNLVIRQTDGAVTLNTPAFAVMATIMDFDIVSANPATLNGTGEIIVGDGFTSQSDNTGVLVEPYAVRIGDYLDNQGTFQPTVTEFFGPGTQQVPSYGNENYTDIIASGAAVQFGDINMAGSLLVTGTASFQYYAYTMNVGGDLVISGSGTFNMWESNVTVGGDLRTEDSGILSMTWAADVLNVSGNAVFGGGNSSLSAGTLNVAGDFTQATGLSAQSFAPGPNHVTVLNGSAAQQVTFESPTLNESRFGDLVIDNTSGGGIVLNTPVLVRDDFLTPATAVTRTVFGQGNAITTYSIDIQDVVFDNAPLDILYDADYAAFSEATSVTFQNMDPTIIQIQIDRGSGTFMLGGVTFDPGFTTGGYVHLDGAFYTMIVQSVMSPEPPGAVTVVNGANYCWDAACA
jgi:hypothetical protein